jgi:hypothetical protein
MERRPRYDLPSPNEQEMLDKITGIKSLLDRVRAKMQNHKGDVNWWDKFVLKRKMNQIEDKVRDLEKLL